MGRNWQGSRTALIAGGLALLAATPAVLAAAGVKKPWLLGAASGMAAVVVVAAAVWQDRYKRVAQRHDEQAFRTEDGCLVLSDGHLPKVSDITDPVLLGAHSAPPIDTSLAGTDTGLTAAHAPTYVPRDIDDVLREQLAVGGFI